MLKLICFVDLKGECTVVEGVIEQQGKTIIQFFHKENKQKRI